MGILLLLVLIVIVIAVMINDSENVKHTNEIVNGVYSNCKFSLVSKNKDTQLLITNRNSVAFVSPKTNVEIYIRDIMKVDIKYNVIEKHKQRVLSVMPTFDTTTSLTSIELNIFTFTDNDLNLFFLVSSYDSNLSTQIEKFKYLVESIKSETTNN